MKIHEALAEVMRSVPAVKKSDRNEAQRFDFRGIDSVLNAVGPKLREHGVLVIPTLKTHEFSQVHVGKAQTLMKAVLVIVDYTFVGPEGDRMTVTVPGEAMDAGDKAFSKAMSVAFRTALLQALALPTDERDPDHDTYVHEGEIVDAKVVARQKAEGRLLARVNVLKMVPADVAKLFIADKGHSIQDEQDPAVLDDFAARLTPNTKAVSK